MGCSLLQDLSLKTAIIVQSLVRVVVSVSSGVQLFCVLVVWHVLVICCLVSALFFHRFMLTGVKATCTRGCSNNRLREVIFQ
jgi:hypothetical protein